MRARAAVSALLVAATAAVYLQIRHHEFLDYDDPQYVTRNPRLLSGLGWEGVAQDFTPYAGNWIPLTWLSLRVDHALYGLEPRGYLLTNLALHALSAVLLFLALARMTGSPGRSAFVAGVFAVHPLHVESVAWVSERKDTLSGVFWMAALLAYARYAERPGAARYGVVALCVGAGLLAKSMLVTLPFVLLLLDVWPLGRLRLLPLDRAALRARAVEKLPLLALAAVSAAVTFRVQQSAGAVFPIEHLAPGARLANALESYVIYAVQSLWPSGLAPFYPHPLRDVAAWRAVGCALLLAAATAAALRTLRARPYLAVGWLWYVGTLIPVIGIVQVGMQAHADRYTYLPQTGLAIAFAWGAADLARRAGIGRTPLAGSALAALAVLAVVAHGQVSHWRDSIAVHARIVAVNPESYRHHNHLASAHLRRGELEPAREHYRTARRLAPGWAPPWLGLADVRAAEGRLDAAIEAYENALRLDPQHASGYAGLGRALLRAGRPDEARAAFERSLALRDESDRDAPEAAPAHFGLGEIAWQREELDAAVAHYERGLRLDPDAARAQAQLGLVYLQAERHEPARERLEQALAGGVGSPHVRTALGIIAEREGRSRDAVRHYRDALALDAGFHAAANNLAWLLATAGDAAVRDPGESVRIAEATIATAGRDDPALLDTLAAAYAAAGRFDEAIATADEAAQRADGGGDEALAASIRRHLARYRAGWNLVDVPPDGDRS